MLGGWRGDSEGIRGEEKVEERQFCDTDINDLTWGCVLCCASTISSLLLINTMMRALFRKARV